MQAVSNVLAGHVSHNAHHEAKVFGEISEVLSVFKCDLSDTIFNNFQTVVSAAQHSTQTISIETLRALEIRFEHAIRSQNQQAIVGFFNETFSSASWHDVTAKVKQWNLDTFWG
jgi:hypothetical protein